MNHIFLTNNGHLDHIFQRNNGCFDHISLRNNGSLLEFLKPLDDLDTVELDILETVGKFNMLLPFIE